MMFLTLGAVFLGGALIVSGQGRYSDSIGFLVLSVVFAIVGHHWSLGMILGGGILIMVVRGRPPNRRRHLLHTRWAFVRFWSAVSLFLSAGLTLWQAVDGALDEDDTINVGIRGMARQLSAGKDYSEIFEDFVHEFSGPEAELVGTMLIHGYQHGLVASDVLEQSQQLEEQLAFEEEFRRRRDPLWMTVLPALLLLNILLLVIGPMGSLIGQSFQGW